MTPAVTARMLEHSKEHSPREQHAEVHDGGSEPLSEHQQFSNRILNIGFVTGLVLAVLCLLMASFYMYRYLNSVDILFDDLAKGSMQGVVRTDLAYLLIQGRLIAARFSLLSCGVLTGLSLALIGFCLFLVGAKGDIIARGEAQHAKIVISRLAPGVFVIICAMLLIGVCTTNRIKFDIGFDTRIDVPNSPNNEYRDLNQKNYQLPSEKTDQKP